jgi:hypothetical protein
MQNKLNLNNSSALDGASASDLLAWAEAALAQRSQPASQVQVQRMVRTLQRLAPAALSALSSTADGSLSAEPSPADTARDFAQTLKTLAQ